MKLLRPTSVRWHHHRMAPRTTSWQSRMFDASIALGADATRCSIDAVSGAKVLTDRRNGPTVLYRRRQRPLAAIVDKPRIAFQPTTARIDRKPHSGHDN